jgi:hypothetical protein
MAKDFVLRRSWLWAMLFASLASPAFAAFQVTTATALPATASTGKTVALAVSVQSSVAASNMVVDLEIYSAAGAKVGQTVNQAQNFAAAKASKYSWNYVAPAAAGKYTLKIGVFTAGWSSLAYWNNSVTSFTVGSAAPPPTLLVNGSCGSSNGQSLTAAPTGNLCSTGTASAVSGSGPWKWSCAGQNGGATASCSATGATAQNQQHGLVPSGLPSTFFVGLAAQPGTQTSWVHNSAVPWAVCYQYLSSGVLPTQTWVTHWGTNFAYNYAVSAHAAGCIPEFTYYQMVPSGGEGAAAEQSTLKNAAIMADYYKDFTALLQQMQQYGGKALVHVEPDMWAYLQTLNAKPSLLPASVASSGNADVAGYPNTVAGFGQALLHLRDLYAPNVIMAAHVSTWLWGGSTDPSLNVAQIAQNDAAFMTGLGNWDLFFTDIADRDSAYYQFVLGDATHWWDTTNQKYPNFNRLNTWAAAFTAAAQKRLVIWQIPVGNTLMKTCNNTNFHYQDNREQYWLENYPNNAAISGLAQAGVIGLLFGAGNSGTTQVYDAAGDGITNPAPINGNTAVSAYSDDDGGLLRLNVGRYYGSGATPLP